MNWPRIIDAAIDPLCVAVGVTLLAIGAFQVSQPLGFIVAGVALTALGCCGSVFRGRRRRPPKNEHDYK